MEHARCVLYLYQRDRLTKEPVDKLAGHSGKTTEATKYLLFQK